MVLLVKFLLAIHMVAKRMVRRLRIVPSSSRPLSSRVMVGRAVAATTKMT